MEGEPVVIMVAALAVIVLLQNRQVALTACYGGTQSLDILRPKLVDDRLAGISQHEFVSSFVSLVPCAVICVLDEFLQELYRPICEPGTWFPFSFDIGRILFRRRSFGVLFSCLFSRRQTLLLDVVVRLNRFHQLRYLGIGQGGLYVVGREARGVGGVFQLVVVEADLDRFRVAATVSGQPREGFEGNVFRQRPGVQKTIFDSPVGQQVDNRATNAYFVKLSDHRVLSGRPVMIRNA
jgi:hypothetical protein